MLLDELLFTSMEWIREETYIIGGLEPAQYEMTKLSSKTTVLTSGQATLIMPVPNRSTI